MEVLASHLCWEEEGTSLDTCRGRIRSGDELSAAVGGGMDQGRGETGSKEAGHRLGGTRYPLRSRQDQTCRTQKGPGAGSSATIMVPSLPWEKSCPTEERGSGQISRGMCLES